MPYKDSVQRPYTLSGFKRVLECNFIWALKTLGTELHYTQPPDAPFFNIACHLHTLKEQLLLAREWKLMPLFLANLNMVNFCLKGTDSVEPSATCTMIPCEFDSNSLKSNSSFYPPIF